MTTYRFAGFWRRFVAYTIDGVIISLMFMVLMIIAGVAFFAGAVSGDSSAWVAKLSNPEELGALTIWMWLFSFVVNIAYFTYFHGSTGRTPGKMLLGLQVVSVQGTPISYGVAFLRSVGYLVSSVVFCLGYIWVAFDKRKQGWHDKIAQTVVIIREPQGDAAGISIPDSPAGPQSPAGFGCIPVAPETPEEKKPETPAPERPAASDDQKIP
ncbi:MAG: RDD family protein [Deltaproteobacteria bacterium]|jgi:uncharacterized RDD family membrane protein YckC|nr:RDD family protein [Syntrophaceae bacterium]